MMYNYNVKCLIVCAMAPYEQMAQDLDCIGNVSQVPVHVQDCIGNVSQVPVHVQDCLTTFCCWLVYWSSAAGTRCPQSTGLCLSTHLMCLFVQI